MSQKTLWNTGWEFVKQPLGTAAETVRGLQEGFLAVDLPHDWMIYDTADLYETGEGWYRKRAVFHKESGKRFSLRFDGVYMDSTVFINGEPVFQWKYGYSAFEFDITDVLREGENEVLVRVVYQCPNTRWYSGAGIFRNVYLIERGELHLASDGIYVHSEKEADGSFRVALMTDVEAGAGTNLGALSVLGTARACQKQEATEGAKECTGLLNTRLRVRHTFFREDNTVLHSCEGALFSLAQALLTDEGGRLLCDSQQTVVSNPPIWDLEAPNLVTLVTELLAENGETLDSYTQKIGFRTAQYDTEKGFLLNGRQVKLYGVCEHHDLGCLGAAFHKEAMRRKFIKLRKMGVNAIRTSHNMPAVEWLELADELGFLIDSEAFDMWERPKTTYDYARFFKEWSETDVTSWVRQDRNHPSVILWSIGNEIYDTHADAHAVEITKRLQAQVHAQDPLHNAPVTIGSNYMPWEGAQRCADVLKVAGYNYAEKYYEEHHKAHPDWVIYGSETASTVQSRGIYHFPYEQSVLCDDDEQCSSLGNCCTSWGAKNSEYCITRDRDASFSMGQFIWTGFDYIGEPTPYSTKNSYFGQLDTAGFEKDAFYIYQAEWTDYKKAPMVHVFPYWDFSLGQKIDVRVASNAPRVELFLNGVSQGDYTIDHAHGEKLLAHYSLAYEPGELRAVAYDENGVMIAEDVEHSFGDAARICLKPEKEELRADGADLLFIEISMQDADGYPVKNANNRVEVQVSGAGRLIGLDNGDSTDYDQYKGTSRRLFSGKLLAVVAAKKEAGVAVIEVSSKGMESVRLLVPVKEAAMEEGLAASAENQKSAENEEIPVRKIALSCDGARILSPERTQAVVTARLCPENATYEEVFWRVTTEGGIDSNAVLLTDMETGETTMSKPEGAALGKTVKLTALGDGKVRLRCNAKNGSDKLRLISELEFEITGLGMANMNPYEFIAGGLYTRFTGEIGNGNERGVATKGNHSAVAFDQVDFGPFGSDEITVPIFELDNRPFPIEIWEGLPGEAGSEKVDTVWYDLPSIWNTYQEKTWKLPRKFKGLTTVCFVTEHGIQIKGFSFKRLEKAYEKISALENDTIYGDTFTIEEEAVTGIGNNVSLAFQDMDFGEGGLLSLTICGRSALPKNTIHVRFSGEDGEVNEIAEFESSKDYTEQTFLIRGVRGRNTVHFVFLPGCQFDFKWFRFERKEKEA